jgi:putative flippase GtrA
LAEDAGPSLSLTAEGHEFQVLKSSLVRYLLTGGFTSLTDFILFSFLATQLHLHELLANVISTAAAMSLSYLINRAFVFRARSASWSSATAFVGVTLFTGLVLQSLVIVAWIWLMGVLFGPSHSGWIVPSAKIVAMACGATANYFSYRFIFARFGGRR